MNHRIFLDCNHKEYCFMILCNPFHLQCLGESMAYTGILELLVVYGRFLIMMATIRPAAQKVYLPQRRRKV